jgi:N6-adenosine-specific RNA methylase IME4
MNCCSSADVASFQPPSLQIDLARSLIERMYPELPKIELFARQERVGWAAWGNEIARKAAE